MAEGWRASAAQCALVRGLQVDAWASERLPS